MLNPINIAGPDQRRKQLMQKLTQQAGQHGAVPMPPGAHGSAAALGAGTGFRSPGLRSNGGVQSTHGNNVLASILARLGVGGRAQDNEMSNGVGAPIGPYGPHYIPPPPANPGNPIPAGGQGGGGLLGGAASNGLTPPGAGVAGINAGTISFDPYAQPSGTGAGAANPNLSDPYAQPSGAGAGVGAVNAAGGRVPLGGGLYYDPSTGTVVNLGSGMGAASLLGGVGHSAI
jgi:hypothetical protein